MKFLSFLSLFLFVISCNESSNMPIDKQKPILNVDSLLFKQHIKIFNALKKQPQKFTLNLEKEKQIIGLDGTIITIQKGCFDEKEIVLELVECYSKMDMIKNGLSTVTINGSLLKSQGMLYLNVINKQGKILNPKANKLSVKVPIEPDTDCKFFNGKEQKAVIVWEENKHVAIKKEKSRTEKEKVKYIKYILYEDFRVKNPKPIDTIYDYEYRDVLETNQVFYTLFNPVSLGWYNLDEYMVGNFERKDIKCVINEKSFSTVVMIPKEFNTVQYLTEIQANENEIIIKKIPDLNADFLFLRYENNRFYYDLVEYQKGSNKKLKINLKTITKEELNILLKKQYGKKFTNEIDV